MKYLMQDAAAFSSVQVHTRLCDHHCVDPRLVAIGLVRWAPSEGEASDFDIQALAMEPDRPSDEIATSLAKWMLQHLDERTRMIGWNIQNPLIMGLRDVARKIEPELAQALMSRLQARASIDAAVPFTLFGPLSLEQAARERNLDFVALNPAALDGAGEYQLGHVRDVAATAAMATWQLWARCMQGSPKMDRVASAALAEWRKLNRAD